MNQTAPLPGLPRHVTLLRAERCDNCKFAVRVQGRVFECHRNPPTTTFINGPEGPMPIAAFAPV